MDVIFVHCPSYYDFRNQLLVTGALTDGINNSAIFEMYPMGFLSMSAKLQQFGYKVRIVNLAMKMLKHTKINVEKYIKSLDASIFGFDLHWMIHAFGAIEISKIFKKIHPNSIILFGGFTASYFARELMEKFPHIDMILRGDSVEPLILRLVQGLPNNSNLHSIPNLLWRQNNKIFENPFTFVPASFEYVNSDFLFTFVKMILQSRDFDLNAYLPSAFYSKKPVIPLLFSKGCTHNCVNCGGSQYAMKKVCNRDKIALKPPAILVSEILEIASCFNFPLRLIGDFQIAPASYQSKFFNLLRHNLTGKIENPIHLEFFTPPSHQYLDQLGEIFSNFSLEISPETGNDSVRKLQGRPFTNAQILQGCKNALELGHAPQIYWFQVGNGFESQETLGETQHLCSELLKLNPQAIFPFISPLNPYIDPGSIAFEHPEKHGYKLLYPTLEQQIEGLRKPIWKYYLNYETQNFTRDDIVKISFEQSILLNDLRVERGALDVETRDELNQILKFASHLLSFLDNQSFSMRNSLPKIQKYFMEGGQIRLKKQQTQITLEGGESLTNLIQSGIKFLSNKIVRLIH